jgi:hypothetical protein
VIHQRFPAKTSRADAASRIEKNLWTVFLMPVPHRSVAIAEMTMKRISFV